jgi:ATP/maltotriose-dependent transcriptional regulator MalT
MGMPSKAQLSILPEERVLSEVHALCTPQLLMNCQGDPSKSLHALQELKDAMQQHKALQQAAAAAKTHAADAAQRQAEHTEENAALRHEIQVRLMRGAILRRKFPRLCSECPEA